MTPEQKAAALARIVAEVELEDVQLVDATVHRQRGAPVGPLHVVVAPTAKVRDVLEDGRFDLEVGIRVTASADDAREPHIEISMSFALQYRMEGGARASKEELKEFAAGNGVFNAWPYARELVHSLTTRMGLRPLILPVMRRLPGLAEEKRARRERRPAAAGKLADEASRSVHPRSRTRTRAK